MRTRDLSVLWLVIPFVGWLVALTLPLLGCSQGEAGPPPDEGPKTVAGCDGAKLLERPADPAARGPWPVGARTISAAGLTVEVWYPAKPGSEAGVAKVTYDIRRHLPDAEAAKIPDAENPLQACDCYRDLPLDEARGPYPIVLFVHGTASFRSQSATQMTHWASRGFVVVSADHPGLGLKDILGGSFGGGMAGEEASALLDAVAQPAGELAFLAGHVDAGRIGAAGHSAGGGAIARLGDRAKVLIPMAAGGVTSMPGSTLVLGGADDGIARYSRQQQGYEAAPPRKRLVGLARAGHLAFSDLCHIGRDRGGILEIARAHGVSVNPLVAGLARDGCMPGQLSAEDGWAIVDFATAAVLEEALHCDAQAGVTLATVGTRFSDVAEFREEL